MFQVCVVAKIKKYKLKFFIQIVFVIETFKDRPEMCQKKDIARN